MKTDTPPSKSFFPEPAALTQRPNAETERLAESDARIVHWKKWGPYLSERAWGTVREDYSPSGDAWNYFPHDHARSRAYRWNEDGLAGISDRQQLICFSIALWNHRDPILKERPFGLTGSEGNHGEDVKELYYYLDSTPTHSYMRYLYKYPQAEFPYSKLVEENRRRGREVREYELVDTGVFDENRYFDVFVEYAKSSVDDLLISIEIANRGPDSASIELLPTIWFRNTWSWGDDRRRPLMRTHASGARVIEVDHPARGQYFLHFEEPCDLVFTENETNFQRLFGVANRTPYVKDAFDALVVHGHTNAVNPARTGTKGAGRHSLTLAPGERRRIRLRLAPARMHDAFVDFQEIVEGRRREADDFYAGISPEELAEDGKLVMRQSLAGLLWSKQFYHYVVRNWLDGDPTCPAPSDARKAGRNADWRHVHNADVLSMPDKWEYPWYAAWDLAFHCVPLAMVDPTFAKEQLILLLREWYMHPNGQIPAYEWALGDVNPPVHAWATWRVYKIDKKRTGVGDRIFLARVFHKLMLNFTWWVNRKDTEGHNIFQGGFLGLDNIGVFDRSAPLPTGGYLEQSDGTSWMAMYSLNMLAIAMELATGDPAYEDVASKFLEHFVAIAHAINTLGLWDETDGFYYDLLHMPNGDHVPMRIRSMVGLTPLFAVETIEQDALDKLPAFKRRMEWFIVNRPDLADTLQSLSTPGAGGRLMLAIVDEKRLLRLLGWMLNENEFLSAFGLRSLSRAHKDAPFRLIVDGKVHQVDYEPAESTSGLFGGNSNWRGPIWFPVNYLIIESLQRFHHYFGDRVEVELPTGSGHMAKLDEVAAELSRRLVRIFLRGPDGRR
ncbi:MAG TPA: glucosidase, partial [Polyangiaceae bacterium]